MCVLGSITTQSKSMFCSLGKTSPWKLKIMSYIKEYITKKILSRGCNTTSCIFRILLSSNYLFVLELLFVFRKQGRIGSPGYRDFPGATFNVNSLSPRRPKMLSGHLGIGIYFVNVFNYVLMHYQYRILEYYRPINLRKYNIPSSWELWYKKYYSLAPLFILQDLSWRHIVFEKTVVRLAFIFERISPFSHTSAIRKYIKKREKINNPVRTIALVRWRHL